MKNAKRHNIEIDRSAISEKMAVLRNGRFGSKFGQIGPKWDKSGAFSD